MLKLAIALFSFIGFSVFANVQISDATIRLLPPSVPNTSAYMQLTNTSEQDITLVGAHAPFANKTEIHTHVLIDGMMRMQQQDSVLIPKQQTVTFQPGGLHIMLFGIKAPLTETQTYPITLTLDNGTTHTFEAVVTKPKAHHHHH